MNANCIGVSKHNLFRKLRCNHHPEKSQKGLLDTALYGNTAVAAT